MEGLTGQQQRRQQVCSRAVALGEVVLPWVYAGHRAGSAWVLCGVERVHDAEMSAPAVQVESRLPRAVPRVLLAVVALSAAFTVGVMLWAGGYVQGGAIDDEVVSILPSLGWALLPFLVAVAMVVIGTRGSRATSMVVAVGVAALVVLTVALLLSFLASESSTAALLFIFLPVYQLLVIGVTAVVAIVVDLLVRQRPARDISPQDRPEGDVL